MNRFTQMSDVRRSELEAQVGVKDMMSSRYGYDQGSLDKSFNTFVKAHNLSGDPKQDLMTLRESNEEVLARGPRLRRDFPDNAFAKYARSIPTLAAEGAVKGTLSGVSGALSGYSDTMRALKVGSSELGVQREAEQATAIAKHEQKSQELFDILYSDEREDIREDIAAANKAKSQEYISKLEGLTGRIKAKQTEGISGKAATIADDVAKFVQKKNEGVEFTWADEEVRNSLVGEISSTIGQMVPMTLSLMSPSTAAFGIGMIYDGIRSSEEELKGENFDPLTNFDSRAAVTISNIAIEKLMGIEALLSKVVKNTGKEAADVTIRELISGFGKKTLIGATGEAIEEPTQGTLEDIFRKTTYDSDYDMSLGEFAKRRGKEAFLAFIAGGFLSGGVAGVDVAPKLFDKFLNPSTAATKADFKAIETTRDDEIRDAVMQQTGDLELAELAVEAKKGNEEARKAYIEKSFVQENEIETAAGVTLEEMQAGLPAMSAPMSREQAESVDAKLRAASIDAAAEILNLPEDIIIDRDDARVVTVKEAIDRDGDRLGMDENQKDAYLTDVITAAAQNNGVSYEEALSKLDKMKVSGDASVEYVKDVLKYRIRLNEGADADTLFEEATHVEFKKFQRSDPKAWEKARSWKKMVEEETGEVTHGNSDREVDEWLARKGVAWAMKNFKNDAKMEKLDSALRLWIERFMAKLKSVFADAKILRKLDEQGKLDPEFKNFLNRATTGGQMGPSTSMALDVDTGTAFQVRFDEQGQPIRELTPEEITAIDLRAELAKAKKEGDKATVTRLQQEVEKADIAAKEARKRQKLQQTFAEKLGKEVERRTKAIRENFQKRKNLEESMKQLETLVQALPLEVRGKFRGFGALVELQTEAAQEKFLKRATDKVDRIFDDYLIATNKAKLTKILKRFSKKQAKKRTALSKNYSKEVRDALVLAGKVARFQQVEKPADMTDEVYSDILATFGGVLSADAPASASKVKDALIEAELMAGEGRLRMERFAEQRKAENAARIEQAKELILGKDVEPKSETELKAEAEQRNIAQRAASTVKTVFFHALNGWQQHMNLLDGKRGGWFEKTFSPINAEIEEGRLNRMHYRDTEIAVDRIFGAGENATKAEKKAATKKAALWMKDAAKLDNRIEIKGKKITKVQALDLLNLWGDKSLASTFEGMEITEAEIAQVKEFLGTEGVALSEYMREAYAQVGQDIQDVHLKVEGFKMDLVDGYGGKVQREGVEIDPNEAVFSFGDSAQGKRASVKNGSMKERTGVTTALVFDNAITKFQQHMREANHYMAFAQWAKDAESTFNPSGEIGRAIVTEHGQDLWNAIQENKNRIIEGGNKAKTVLDRLGNKFRANLTTAQLAIKPAITIKQLTSIPAFTEDIGFRAYGKASLELMQNPLKIMKELYNSDYIKNRLDTTQYADIRQEIERADGILRKISPSEWLMFNVKAGDIGAVIVGGAPVYVHYKNEANAKGLRGANAREYAMAKFAEASDRAQQASSESSKGYYLGSQGWMRSFFMYLTSPMQYQRNINVATVNLAQSISKHLEGKPDAQVKETLQQFYRAAFVYHILLPQIFQAVASGGTGLFDFDDEEFWNRQKKALLLGNFAVFPILGQLASYIADDLSDTGENFRSTGSPLLDYGSDLTQAITKIWDEPDDEQNWYNLLEDLSKMGGIPLETTRKGVENVQAVVEGDTDYPIQRLLQWSAWSLGEN